MGEPTQVFWSDLAKDLEDPDFLREFIVESVRVRAIDQMMNQLEDARDEAGISKADLARSINAKPAAIRRLLSSKNTNPTLGTLSEVAAVLGYSVTLTPMTDVEQRAVSLPLRVGTTTAPSDTIRILTQERAS